MINLKKLEARAPGLVDAAKAAEVSLVKGALAGQRMAVYLVVDRSGSMASYYRDGSVQHLADRVLALSTRLDDDGQVPLVMFDHRLYPTTIVALDDYQGAVAAKHRQHGGDLTMGCTEYAIAMQAVINHYQASGAADPALVVFQTDGIPDDAYDTEQLLRTASKLPMFWSFVGFGRHRVGFLDGLDKLRGRAVDNAAYVHLGSNPQALTDAELYDGITNELPGWLSAARQLGIVR
ncbi:VWA domain-containing protein [Streptomyces sp. NPDC005302]|uniref:VWA domain-containing protein n=1 Tax=Streptomyces sp. NPDC005302 TaxID=3154675 RepID=UPI0033B6C462